MTHRPFRTAVGEVAQQAAVLEGVVAITAWGLAGLEQETARIVVPNNMDRMLNLISDLLRQRVRDEGLIAEVEAWVREVRAAYQERNRVIHSVWVGDGGEEPYWRVDLRPLGRPKESRTAGDLLELAQVLESLGTARAVFLGPLASHVGGPWSVFGATDEGPQEES